MKDSEFKRLGHNAGDSKVATLVVRESCLTLYRAKGHTRRCGWRTGVHHIGGFREESYFSLEHARQACERRIPKELLWIVDDPFGNAICLGLSGMQRGRMYFWSHECEPDDEHWDGGAETAGNVYLLAGSFAECVAGLRRHEGATRGAAGRASASTVVEIVVTGASFVANCTKKHSSCDAGHYITSPCTRRARTRARDRQR